MVFLKTRPNLTLRLPPRIQPGDQVDAELVVVCEKPLLVEWIRVEIEGTERSEPHHRRILSLLAELETEGELPAGSNSLRFRFALPSSLPASYEGTAASIRYVAAAHVSIPWWPDRRESFRVDVQPLPVSDGTTEPKIYSSNTSRTGLHIELSLGRDWARAGGIVYGAFSLMGMDVQNITDVSVQMRPIETLTIQKRSWNEICPSLTLKIDQEILVADEMIPFEFKIPKTAHPGFHRREEPPGMCALSWKLALIVQQRRGGETGISVPFHILPFSASSASSAPSRAPVPTVGSDRVGRIWTRVGSLRGLTHEGGALVGERDECTLEIRRVRQDGQLFVVAEVRYPHLNLEISVSRANKLRQLVGGGVVVDDPAWDRKHRALARDASQGRHILKPLVAALAALALPALTESIYIHALSDELLVLRTEDNGTDHDSLLDFVDRVFLMADTLRSARAAIPPPLAVVGMLDEWTQLAHTLGGRLETARMRISMSLTKASGYVAILFGSDGTPLCIEVAVSPNQPLEVESWTVNAQDDDPSEELAQHIKGETHTLCRRLAAGALQLSITPETLRVRLPLKNTQKHLFSDEASGLPDVPKRLARLLQLMERLRAGAGPYR